MLALVQLILAVTLLADRLAASSQASSTKHSNAASSSLRRSQKNDMQLASNAGDDAVYPVDNDENGANTYFNIYAFPNSKCSNPIQITSYLLNTCIPNNKQAAGRLPAGKSQGPYMKYSYALVDNYYNLTMQSFTTADCSSTYDTFVISYSYPDTCEHVKTVHNTAVPYYYYEYIESSDPAAFADVTTSLPTYPPGSTGYVDAHYLNTADCLANADTKYIISSWYQTLSNVSASNSTHGDHFCFTTPPLGTGQFFCYDGVASKRTYKDATCGYQYDHVYANNTDSCSKTTHRGQYCVTKSPARDWHTTQKALIATILVSIVGSLICFGGIYFCVGRYMASKAAANGKEEAVEFTEVNKQEETQE